MMHRLGCWLLLVAAPSLADKHPLYRAQRTLAGVATYHARHEVGNLLFSLAPIDRDDAQAPSALGKLTFRQGNPPPQLHGRAYFPDSLGMLMRSVGYPTRNEQLSWQLWLPEREQADAAVRPEQHAWTTAGTAWDGRRLASLKPGIYRVVVWVAITFQMLRPNFETGVAEWVDDSFSVAQGTLTVEVTP
jgi:hypothetical protein